MVKEEDDLTVTSHAIIGSALLIGQAFLTMILLGAISAETGVAWLALGFLPCLHIVSLIALTAFVVKVTLWMLDA
jgi:hypothetical protein